MAPYLLMSRPQIWGIVNVTPDSFSDGGRYVSLEAALDHARRLIAAGADVLDIGGESTRPGAEPVSLDDELARVIPLIETLRRETSTPISIDTLKPEAAAAAIAAGATIWNDVTALRGSDHSLATAAALGCEVVLMHMQGEPRTMQAAPHYEDVTAEVISFLVERIDAALSAGVAQDRIWLDPGIGFGKTLVHNLALLKRLPEMVALGYPMLLGASRKRFIAGLDPSAASAEDRLGGSLAAALRGAEAGCAAVRVHDVRETRQALEVWAAIRDA
jgi:dihydropteroate synthase